MQKYNFSGIEKILVKNIKDLNQSVGFLMMGMSGEILYKNYINNDQASEGFSDNSLIHIASGCKWISMALAVQLVECGLIDLNDKISKYYPVEFSNADTCDITIIQLMTHTSGFEILNEWCENHCITLQQSVQGIGQGGMLNNKWIDRAKVMFSPPGCKILYSDVGMQVVGGIVEKVTGKSWTELFNTSLKQKLKLANTIYTGFDGIKNSQNIAIADGMLSNMMEYANFLLMLLNKGKFDGQQILNEQSLNIMLKNYTLGKKIHKDNLMVTMDKNPQHAIGSWIFDCDRNGNPEVFSSPGIYGFTPWIDISKKYLAILMVHTSEDKANDTVEQLIYKINKIYSQNNHYE